MKLSQRDRRALMLLVFAAVLFAFMNYVVLPSGEKFLTSGNDLRLAEKKLRQKKELVASAAQVDAQMKAMQAQLDAQEQKLATTADPNQASAQLQEWISQRATEQKVELQRSDFLPVAAFGDNYQRVPIRLELNGQITQVVQFMNTLTHSDKVVSVDELNVSGGYADKEKKVHCSMVVSTLMRNAS